MLLLWLKRLFTSGRQKAQLSNTQSNLPWPANIFFFPPKDSPVAEEHKPLEKKWSFCVCLFAYLFWIDQTKKKKKRCMGLHVEKSTLSLYISWLESVSNSGRHLFFNRFFLRLSSLSYSAPKSFSVFLMLVVELLRCMCGLVWVGEQWFKKKKKKSHLFSLIWQNDQNIFSERLCCM